MKKLLLLSIAIIAQLQGAEANNEFIGQRSGSIQYKMVSECKPYAVKKDEKASNTETSDLKPYPIRKGAIPFEQLTEAEKTKRERLVEREIKALRAKEEEIKTAYDKDPGRVTQADVKALGETQAKRLFLEGAIGNVFGKYLKFLEDNKTWDTLALKTKGDDLTYKQFLKAKRKKKREEKKAALKQADNKNVISLLPEDPFI